MATSSIDKSLYQAPLGLEQEDASPIEIEIEDPEAVHIGIGDIEIDLKPQKPTAEDFDANLADFIEDKDLQSLGMDLVSDFDKDQHDRDRKSTRLNSSHT